MPKTDYSNVVFTPMQLEYLQSLYPATVFGPTATEAQLRQYMGTQAVIEAVAKRTRGLRNAASN